MGCMENEQKAFVDENFIKKEKVEGKEVEGTECAESTIIPKKALREKLDKVVGNEFDTKTLKSVAKDLKKVLSEILKYHSCTFLPKNMSKLVINMIELREDFNRLAEERTIKRAKPKKNYE